MTTNNCVELLRPDQTTVFAINRQIDQPLRNFVYRGHSPNIINSPAQGPSYPVYNAISEFIKKGIQ